MGEEKRSPSGILRRMLDERGIEWETGEDFLGNEETWWRSPVFDADVCVTLGEESGTVQLDLPICVTPDQAIAATVGPTLDQDLQQALDFMRIWITDDAHLGESDISYELEKAEGLRKLEAIEQAIAATVNVGETYTREECEAQFVRGFSLGCLPSGSDPCWDENGQTLDEHMAELGWVRKDAEKVERSCASCPEMDNPDSYIVHLQSALKWHDEHVPRPTNPRNTCVVLKGERPPEEVLFVREDGEVMHYLPEGTCENEWAEFGKFKCSKCGLQVDSMSTNTTVPMPIRHCPNCGGRIVKEEAE